MASSVTDQVVQVLLRHLRAKDTSRKDALKLADMIARYKKIDRVPPNPLTEPVSEEKPVDDVLGGLK